MTHAMLWIMNATFLLDLEIICHRISDNLKEHIRLSEETE